MRGIRGVIGLGPSARTVFHFGERMGVGWQKKVAHVMGVSSQLSKMRVALPIWFLGVPSLILFHLNEMADQAIRARPRTVLGSCPFTLVKGAAQPRLAQRGV